MTYKSSTGTASEAFLSLGSGLQGIGVSRLRTRSADTAFKAGRSKGRRFRIETRYFAWDLWCNQTNTGKTWLTSTYRWQPELWTGGASYRRYRAKWACNPDHVVRIVSFLQVGDDESVTHTLQGGVDLGRLGTGRVNQTLSSEVNVSVKYTRLKGARKAKLCGRYGVPSTQLEMKEVR